MSMDSESREKERLSASGDFDATKALIRIRMRRQEKGPLWCKRCRGDGVVIVGEGPAKRCPGCDGDGRAPFSSAVALAYYCGDQVAQELMNECPLCGRIGGGGHVHGGNDCPWCHSNAAHYRLDDWFRMLSHWGEHVKVRAANIAAQVVIASPVWKNKWGWPGDREPGGPRRATDAVDRWLETGQEDHRCAAIDEALRCLSGNYLFATGALTVSGFGGQCDRALSNAARLLSGQVELDSVKAHLRAVISQKLIGWAIYENPNTKV